MTSVWKYKEYITQNRDEVSFLKKNGIRYEFVFYDENKISTYKFKKCQDLFLILGEFYKEC